MAGPKLKLRNAPVETTKAAPYQREGFRGREGEECIARLETTCLAELRNEARTMNWNDIVEARDEVSIREDARRRNRFQIRLICPF